MANPIQETPILTGDDARKFAKDIANPKPLTENQIKELKESYEKLKSILK